MRKLILVGLMAGGWIVALCHAAHGQCYSTPSYSYRSYAPSYSYPSYSYAAPSYSAPAYVAPKKVEYKNDITFLRFVAYFPVLDAGTYGVSLVAPAAVYQQPGVQTPQTPAPAAAQPPASAEITKLLDAIKVMNKSVELIDARLNRLEGNGGNGNGGGAFAPKGQRAPEPQPPQQQTAAQIVAAKCVVCHNPEKAADWGNSFSLVDEAGKLEKLSDKAVKKMVKHCMAGTMPPKEAPKGFAGKLPPPLTDPEASALVAFYSGATKDARQERLEIADVADARPVARTLVRR